MAEHAGHGVTYFIHQRYSCRDVNQWIGGNLSLIHICADVVADENNGAILVYLCQQCVEAGFETLVDVCAGFVENHHLRVGDDGTAQELSLIHI